MKKKSEIVNAICFNELRHQISKWAILDLTKKSLFTIIISSQLILSCKDMSRFRFERYICGDNRSGIQEIIVRSARLKAKVQINKDNNEITGIIEDSSEEWLKVVAENLLLDINRNTGLIKSKNNLNSVFTHCQKSVFTF